MAKVSLNNDSLAFHLCEHDAVSWTSYSHIGIGPFNSGQPTGRKGGFGNRGFVLDLGGRELLVGTVPTISSVVLVVDAVSSYPGILVVFVGRLVVDDGVLPRILVVLAMLVAVTRVSREGAMARSIAESAVGHNVSSGRGSDCYQCNGQLSCCC